MLLSKNVFLRNIQLRLENFRLWVTNKKLEDKIHELEHMASKTIVNKRLEQLGKDNRMLIAIDRKKDKEIAALKKQLKGYELDEKINEE